MSEKIRKFIKNYMSDPDIAFLTEDQKSKSLKAFCRGQIKYPDSIKEKYFYENVLSRLES